MECSYGCLSNFDLPPPESPSGRNKLTVPFISRMLGRPAKTGHLVIRLWIVATDGERAQEGVPHLLETRTRHIELLLQLGLRRLIVAPGQVDDSGLWDLCAFDSWAHPPFGLLRLWEAEPDDAEYPGAFCIVRRIWLKSILPSLIGNEAAEKRAALTVRGRGSLGPPLHNHQPAVPDHDVTARLYNQRSAGVPWGLARCRPGA